MNSDLHAPFVSQKVIDAGLRMLADRRRMLGKSDEITDLDRNRISRQIALSEAPWKDMQSRLAKRSDLFSILCDLWPQVVPYLIKGNEVSPIHHIPYVVSFMSRIGFAELPQEQLTVGMISALLHDIGIGDCALPKISEASIQRASGEKRLQLRRDGIESRLEHMRKGVQISREILLKYQSEHSDAISQDEIQTILDLVGSHDFSKIPLMEDHVDRKWLLSSSRSDWLKQCHWEADAVWMLSPAGILVDLEREKETDTPANRKAKFDFNLGLHREIISLYARAYSSNEMAAFEFHDGLLYRSNIGYEIAMEFEKLSRDPQSNFYS